MELRESTTYYPSDARLSKMSRLCIGWSTVAAKNDTCYSSWDQLYEDDGDKVYCSLSDDEQEVIHKVIMQAEVEDMNDHLKKQEHAKKYHQLVAKCSGNGESSCILCGVTFKGRRIPQNCHDCTKKICARCRCSYSLKNCHEVTLCRVCFSYRELWKKTGAWFTRDIEPYMDNVACHHVRTKPWSGNVSAPSKEEHKSLVHSSLHPDSLSSATSEAESPAASSPAIKASYSTDESGLPICSIDDFSPALAYGKNFQCPQDSFITSPEASSQMVNRLRGKTRKNFVHQAAIDVCDDDDGRSDLKESTDVCIDNGVRLDRSISLPVANKHCEANATDGKKNVLLHSMSQDREDKKSRKEKHSFVKSLSLRPSASKQGRMKNSCGSIDFTMEYSADTSELKVHIILCQSLLPADANGSSDPYVVLYLSPGGKHTKRSTRVVSENLNPVFNEDIIYPSISTSIVRHSELVLVVFDYDVISRDDFLGATSIPLRRALHGGVMTFSLALKNQYPAFIYVNGAGNNGQVLISMNYSTSSKALSIHVFKAARLSPTHSSTSANPYVKVFLLKDRRVELKMKTSVCMGSLNPDFNEEMTIPIDLQGLNKRRIRIAVWHHRKTAHNVSMGTAILDPSAPGILSAVLSSPDKTIREWIVLSG